MNRPDLWRGTQVPAPGIPGARDDDNIMNQNVVGPTFDSLPGPKGSPSVALDELTTFERRSSVEWIV